MYVHIYIYMFSYMHLTRAHNDIILIAAKLASLCVLHDLIPRLFPHVWNEPGNKANECICTLASFPGLLSPNAVEGLVKLVRRMTSGGHLEAWLIAPCMHNTAVHRKCHASRRPPDVILRTSFTMQAFHRVR